MGVDRGNVVRTEPVSGDLQLSQEQLVQVGDQSVAAFMAPCITFYLARGRKLGIRNNCGECKTAVVNWLPKVGVKKYRVPANDQIEVDRPDDTSVLIGEDPC